MFTGLFLQNQSTEASQPPTSRYIYVHSTVEFTWLVSHSVCFRVKWYSYHFPYHRPPPEVPAKREPGTIVGRSSQVLASGNCTTTHALFLKQSGNVSIEMSMVLAVSAIEGFHVFPEILLMHAMPFPQSPCLSWSLLFLPSLEPCSMGHPGDAPGTMPTWTERGQKSNSKNTQWK